MKHKDLFKILKELDIPVAYDHFDTDVEPPFIVYREQQADSFYADNKTFKLNLNFELELVTIKKDIELEEKIINLLDKYNIPFEKQNEIWDNEEKIYHIIFEI